MKKLLTEPIRFYQKHISPATQPTCRYHPTCSHYALEAVEKHGALKGGVMGLARIMRCNPFVEGGVDEVPDHFTVRRNPENIGDFYIPEHLMTVDTELEEKLNELLDIYEEELNVHENFPESAQILANIADTKELNAEDIRNYFTADELSYLEDIDIFPDFTSADYRYFTLEETEQNEPYLETVEPYFEETTLGTQTPLVVLEKPGIWYTNLPELARRYLIERGVTEQDIEDNSYHLWLVLNAHDESTSYKA